MFVVFVVINVLLTSIPGTISVKQKRQLFRENLLPLHGGKIPEAAFHPARLVLNKFNQNGLFVPEGYTLEQRPPDRHYLPKKYLPETLKVNFHRDNRLVPTPEGYQFPQTADTTYVIKKPVNYHIWPRKNHKPFETQLPHASVKLVRQYKYRKFNDASSWSGMFPSANYASRILMEFAPYLERLGILN